MVEITQQSDYAQQAAQWLVALSDDRENTTDIEQQYLAWKQAKPEHAQAAMKMEQFLGRMEQLDALGTERNKLLNSGLQAGVKAGKSLRLPVGLLPVVFVLFLLPCWMFIQNYSPAYLFADIKTSRGEWRTQQLSDGSQLSLASGTAVNVDFSMNQRRLILLSGEIKVTVAKDKQRPFIVSTDQGEITALGTQFIVKENDDTTQLLMLESVTRVENTTDENRVINAGHALRFDRFHFSDIQTIDPHAIESAWYAKVLVAENMPLPRVLTTLASNRSGRLVFDKEALSSIDVSGVLPLDDTDAALDLLLQRFPQLEVRYLTPYFVYVSKKV